MSELRPITDFTSTPWAPVAPPVSTRPQTLPFGELQWEAFEWLCLRLVQEEATPEACRFYGDRGNAQEGIDFFALAKNSGRYRSYQCKRVERFKPSELKAAVQVFLDGDFAAKSESLTLCAAVPLKSKSLADEIEAARGQLNARGVALEIWDADHLSQTLKGRRDLVADFFGPSWADAFCGALDAPAPSEVPTSSRRWPFVTLALVFLLVVGGALAVREQRASEPSRWLKFETLNVYKVIPDPGDAGPRDVFIGVVLEVKSTAESRTFEVQDLKYSGGFALEAVGPGGIISRIEGFGQDSRVVGGGAVKPGELATVAVVFPFIHRDESPDPAGGVLPVFTGDWTLVVDGQPLTVGARYKSEGTVLRSSWDGVVGVWDLRLKPTILRSTIPDPWKRREPSDPR